MIHSFRARTVTLLVLILLVLAATTASSAASFLQSPTTIDKIAPWVLDNTVNGAQAEMLVVLTTQADLSRAARLSTKLEKGRLVYDTLYGTAQRTQAPITQWLKARGVEYRAYYIVNLIWVKADRATALALAARSDVARLEGNPHVRLIPEPTTAIDLTAPNVPTGVEPGINYTRAPDVWALGFTGQGIVVGGQDTGIQWDHPALKNHYRGWNTTTLTVTHDFNWHDSIHTTGSSCGANSPAPCDDYGHGTHTMGTAVGSDGGANQIGVAPGARFIGCRNMNAGVGSPATYLECFEFFLAPYPVGGTPAQGNPDLAPDVTNNSWGCPPGEGCNAASLLAAVQAQRAAGIMTVASAGNSGSACNTVTDPIGIYDEVYTVGALATGTDSIAGFSSRGAVMIDGSHRPKPDIAAPGTGTRSSVPGSGYGSMSGTSMASPHVAGAVALLWSVRPDLKNQIDATEQVLNDSAVHISSTACGSSGWPNNTFGYGRLDVLAAVGVNLTPIVSMQAAPAGNTVTHTLFVTNTGPLTDTFDFTIGSHLWPTSMALTTTGALTPGTGMPVAITVVVPISISDYAFDVATIAVVSRIEPGRRVTATLTTTNNQPIMTPKTATRFVKQPDGDFIHTLQLTNTDSVSHTFDIALSSSMWVCGAPATVGPIAPHSSVQFGVAICVFVYAGGYDTSVVDVTATAADDVLLSVTSTLTTTVLPYWDVRLFAFRTAISASPGTTVTYPLHIDNCGNVSDTYHLSYADNVWDARLSITETQLEGDGRICNVDDFLAYVTIPSTATLGRADILQITAIGTGVSDTLTLTTTAAAMTYLPVVIQSYP